MVDKPYDMYQHVARTLCAAAQGEGACLHCFHEDDCTLWPTFMKESRCSVEAVRDWCTLMKRSKPRLRDPEDIAKA